MRERGLVFKFTARTCAEAADVGEDDGVGLAAGHARAHLAAAEGRVEHIRVHRLLPHIDALRPALVPAQLRLRAKRYKPLKLSHMRVRAPTLAGTHCSQTASVLQKRRQFLTRS